MKVIIERLIESVEDETGIKLTSKDFQVTADSENLRLVLWNQDLLEMPYNDGDLEDDEFAEEVVDELFTEHYDLREKIVEFKLNQFNGQQLPALKEKVLEFLSKNKVEKRLLDILDLEFMDMGYIQGNFSSAADEEWDYPLISLRVTDFEDLEFYINIDPYKGFDTTTVCNEILKKIRGKI
jgi:hypothetical protein